MKKKILALVLVLVMLIATLSGCGGATKIRMATGGTTGTYYAYGGIIAQILGTKLSNVSFDVQSTGASKANIYLVSDGEVEMAMVQNDVMDYAYNGTSLFDGEKVSGIVDPRKVTKDEIGLLMIHVEHLDEEVQA